MSIVKGGFPFTSPALYIAATAIDNVVYDFSSAIFQNAKPSECVGVNEYAVHACFPYDVNSKRRVSFYVARPLHCCLLSIVSRNKHTLFTIISNGFLCFIAAEFHFDCIAELFRHYNSIINRISKEYPNLFNRRHNCRMVVRKSQGVDRIALGKFLR